MPEAPLENALRRLLLTRFDFYFTSKISTEQKDAKLVSERKRSLVRCSYCQVIEQYFLSTISRRENKTCLLFGNSVLVRISHYGAKLLILLTRSRNIPATEIEGKTDDSCLSLNLLMLLSENYWRARSSNIIHTEFRGESLRRESCLRYRRVFSFFSLRSLLIWIHSPSPNYQSMRSMKQNRWWWTRSVRLARWRINWVVPRSRPHYHISKVQGCRHPPPAPAWGTPLQQLSRSSRVHAITNRLHPRLHSRTLNWRSKRSSASTCPNTRTPKIFNRFGMTIKLRCHSSLCSYVATAWFLRRSLPQSPPSSSRVIPTENKDLLCRNQPCDLWC